MDTANNGWPDHSTVDEFDDYSVALSSVTMLSTLATLSLEKYALRAVALFVVEVIAVHDARLIKHGYLQIISSSGLGVGPY